MKSRIVRSTLLVLVQACLLLILTPLLCHGQAGDTANSAARTTARATYNRTLEKLFRDLESAKSKTEMSAARSLARDGFAKAIAQDASYSLPYFNLGVLAEADEDWHAAIKYFEQFVRLNPKSDLAAKAAIKLQTLAKWQQIDSTEKGRKKREYDQALATVYALLNLGLVQEALSTTAQASLIDDTRWELYALVGKTLADRGLYLEASSYLEKAVRRAPTELRQSLSRVLELCRSRTRT